MGLNSFQTKVTTTPSYSFGASGSLASFAPSIAGGGQFTTGTGQQVSQVYASTAGLSVTSGTPLVLNLHDGSLKDLSGAPIVATALAAYDVIVRSGTGTLAWGTGTNPIAGVAGSLGQKGVAHVENPVNGFTVTSGSADSITFTSSSGAIGFDLVLATR